MPMFSSALSTWTPAVIADGAQVSTLNFHALRSAAATNFCRICEVYIGGEATSSTVDAFALRRHTTHSTGPTNLVPAPLNPASQAAVHQSFQAVATTLPTVAAIATIRHLLNLSLNAFGGIVRWYAAPGEEIWFFGVTANNDEISLSTTVGTGVVSSHFIVEEL
jgi:hypothetical protein